MPMFTLLQKNLSTLLLRFLVLIKTLALLGTPLMMSVPSVTVVVAWVVTRMPAVLLTLNGLQNLGLIMTNFVAFTKNIFLPPTQLNVIIDLLDRVHHMQTPQAPIELLPVLVIPPDLALRNAITDRVLHLGPKNHWTMMLMA